MLNSVCGRNYIYLRMETFIIKKMQNLKVKQSGPGMAASHTFHTQKNQIQIFSLYIHVLSVWLVFSRLISDGR